MSEQECFDRRVVLLDSVRSLASSRGKDSLRQLEYQLEYFHIMEGTNFGWLLLDGSFLGCSYGSHQRLLDTFGLGSSEIVENCGWMHVSFLHRHERTRVYALHPPTVDQLYFLQDNDVPKHSVVTFNSESRHKKKTPCILGSDLSPKRSKAFIEHFAEQTKSRSGKMSWEITEP